jgi:hypothetical protein
MASGINRFGVSGEGRVRPDMHNDAVVRDYASANDTRWRHYETVSYYQAVHFVLLRVAA